MNKILIILGSILITTKIYNSNLCWGYPKGKRLRQIPIEKIHNCHCQCWKYSKTKGDNNFYICTECRHRLTPEEVSSTSKKTSQHNKYKRWNQQP